ncbi:ATP-binding protein [Candidatus Parcubacteria bacterium]|nr:ATP-binding protein [Candidatus Parcubacteria bacterium]
MSVIETTPNVRAMESLKHVGYSNEAAIADLVDNSMDAGADRVHIQIGADKIAIVDNGSGMDRFTLEEAIKLGSNTQRSSGDLGKFGMGLVTASLSLGRKLTVHTEDEGSLKAYTVKQDLNLMIDKNKYYADLDESVKIGKSGTSVVIQNLDNLKYKHETLVNRVREELSRIFRHYIKAGKIISVNGEKLTALDPLMLDEEGAELYSDDTYDVNGKIIRIRVAFLPKFSKEEQKRRNVNSRTQGFYLVRNSREIVTASTLGMFTRDWWNTRIRIEVMFSDDLDAEFGIDFTKSKLTLKNSVRNLIHEATRKQISHLINRTKSTAKLDDKEAIVKHSESEQTIRQKNKLLILPKGNKEMRETAGGAARKKTKAEGKSKDRLNVSKTHEGNKDHPARGIEILEGHHSQFGPIFYCYMVGQKTIVEWNYDHPFYERMLLRFREEKDVITALDYLAYSFGVAEMTVQTEESQDVFGNYHSVASSNLRTLLS